MKTVKDTEMDFVGLSLIFLLLIVVAGIVSIAAIGVWGVRLAFDVSETHECRVWQADASKYADYYIMSWQQEQCQAHHITINAPVK